MGVVGSEEGKSPGAPGPVDGCSRGGAGGLTSGPTGLWGQAPRCSSAPGRLFADVPNLSW